MFDTYQVVTKTNSAEPNEIKVAEMNKQHQKTVTNSKDKPKTKFLNDDVRE